VARDVCFFTMTNALRFLPIALAFASSAAFAANPPAKADAFDPRLGPPFEIRDRPSLGSDKAPIVVVEFGSYKCSHCYEFLERAFPQLDEQYIKTGKVQWFMVPSSDNPADPSGKIFAVGRCLQRQGKFWDQLEFLMTISNRPSSFLNDLIAKNSAIDSSELAFCLQDREIPRIVAKDFDEFHLLKVPGTPTFFIRKLRADGSRTETIVRGYQPADYFQRIFDELAKTP
jgi:protein-disulfide isomerase